ncbi:MAG: IS1595 family transposase [Reyranellaceae bacterium]
MSVLSKPYFHDETAAYAFLESVIWPNGPTCPHCGNADSAKIGTLKGTATRPGVKKCYACRKQFTVKVGTVYESSHVPLHKWLQATFLLTSGKKGFSSHQLHRVLEVTYKTAWFMAHRIREAMKPATPEPMGGDGAHVEVDETYIGRIPGVPKRRGHQHKRTVVTLVERGGEARSFHVEKANAKQIGPILAKHIKAESTLQTDEAKLYIRLGEKFADHQSVNHVRDEYVRGTAHTNTVEGFYSIFKRGFKGIYQHCDEKHLHRYLAEFDFRYSNRSAVGVEDSERATKALREIVGKRLTYRSANDASY